MSDVNWRELTFRLCTFCHCARKPALLNFLLCEVVLRGQHLPEENVFCPKSTWCRWWGTELPGEVGLGMTVSLVWGRQWVSCSFPRTEKIIKGKPQRHVIKVNPAASRQKDLWKNHSAGSGRGPTELSTGDGPAARHTALGPWGGKAESWLLLFIFGQAGSYLKTYKIKLFSLQGEVGEAELLGYAGLLGFLSLTAQVMHTRLPSKACWRPARCGRWPHT